MWVDVMGVEDLLLYQPVTEEVPAMLMRLKVTVDPHPEHRRGSAAVQNLCQVGYVSDAGCDLATGAMGELFRKPAGQWVGVYREDRYLQGRGHDRRGASGPAPISTKNGSGSSLPVI